MVAPVWVLYRQESGDFAEATALMRDGDQHLLASDGDFLKQAEAAGMMARRGASMAAMRII